MDTLKVRLMGKQGQKDLEVVDNFYSAPPDEEASETSDMSEGEESEDTDEPLVFQVSSSEGRPGRGPGGDSGNVAVQAQPQAEVETERGSGEHAEEVNARSAAQTLDASARSQRERADARAVVVAG